MAQEFLFSESVDSASLPQPALWAAASAIQASTNIHPLSQVPPKAWQRLPHHPNLIIFALLFLAIGTGGIIVGGRYWSDRTVKQQAAVTAIPAKPTIAGLNLTVPAYQLSAKLQTITSQPAILSVGEQTVPISPDIIKGWLQISTNKAKTEDYIRIKAGAMEASLNQMANQFVKSPINAVTVTEDGVARMVVSGRNGTSLSDPNALKNQANQVAKTVMDAKGLKFTTPLQTQSFQSVTPAAFGKLIVANVSIKKMWAFQNGQQVNNWLISAGKPTTPTPLGEFHVYAKYTIQDMRGFNPDGTRYFQPHVRWIDYFSGGSAIHGVYWHPLSWFGVNNSSHGCVGLPENEAAWIYNWAPIGTTVITHA